MAMFIEILELPSYNMVIFHGFSMFSLDVPRMFHPFPRHSISDIYTSDPRGQAPKKMWSVGVDEK